MSLHSTSQTQNQTWEDILTTVIMGKKYVSNAMKGEDEGEQSHRRDHQEFAAMSRSSSQIAGADQFAFCRDVRDTLANPNQRHKKYSTFTPQLVADVSICICAFSSSAVFEVNLLALLMRVAEFTELAQHVSIVTSQAQIAGSHDGATATVSAVRFSCRDPDEDNDWAPSRGVERQHITFCKCRALTAEVAAAMSTADAMPLSMWLALRHWRQQSRIACMRSLYANAPGTTVSVFVYYSALRVAFAQRFVIDNCIRSSKQRRHTIALDRACTALTEVCARSDFGDGDFKVQLPCLNVAFPHLVSWFQSLDVHSVADSRAQFAAALGLTVQQLYPASEFVYPDDAGSDRGAAAAAPPAPIDAHIQKQMRGACLQQHAHSFRLLSDADNSRRGEIRVDKIGVVLRMWGEQPSPAELKSLVHEVDASAFASIDLPQLVCMMSRKWVCHYFIYLSLLARLVCPHASTFCNCVFYSYFLYVFVTAKHMQRRFDPQRPWYDWCQCTSVLNLLSCVRVVDCRREHGAAGTTGICRHSRCGQHRALCGIRGAIDSWSRRLIAHTLKTSEHDGARMIIK